MQTSVTRRKPRTTHRPTHTLLPTLQTDYISWPRLGLLYNVLNNTSSHYDLDYNLPSLSPDGDACRLRSESHQVSGSAVLCITTDFPSFSSSSSLLSSLLGDISWVRWTACVIINLGGRGPLLSVPPPHGMEAGSPRRRMRRMSRRFPRGFCMGIKGAGINIWNGERYPRAAADIARLPALLLPSYCYMKTIII